MAAGKSHPIIIKRVKKRRGGGHHGGSWKIAYADFVTAMMAFFLLMWLIGSTAQGDLEGIAEYFRTPLRVALQGGTGSGDSSSVITGGGEDLTRTTGQVQKSDSPNHEQTINLMKARDALKREELEDLEDLKKKVERTILDDPKLARFREQIRLKMTPEGLQILIVDDLSRPMFDTGGDALKVHTQDILHAIGGLLNGVDNAISLAGHTDAAPYALGERGYSNWELSADRANAARRELVAGGMDESKVLRVVGLSSSLPLDTENPLNPINRRISLVVLNNETKRAILGEEQLATVSVQDLRNDGQGSGTGSTR
ncbi:MAG: flagellar motor protein MotB [Woeseiaceae bacterium]